MGINPKSYNMYPEPSTSTAQNPVILFMQDGTDPHAYAHVRLTVTDADGDSNVIEKTDYIYVGASYAGGPYTPCREVTASFSGIPTSGYAPLTVNFTNNSMALEPPLTYAWDFDNDGTVDSTADNPSYTYNVVGTYSVKLTATDPYGRTDTVLMTDYVSVTTFSGDISAGYEHTLLIKSDRTLWAWGHNDAGQVGDGTTTDRLSPVQVGSDSDWLAVEAGWKHSMALKENGTLWAWGDNTYAQLGEGTMAKRLSPSQIGADADWSNISAGGAHNLALKQNSTLWAWGLNSNGQIGDSTTTIRMSPVPIGSDTDWNAISAGWEHSAAIKINKTLYTWGWNSDGQVGDGTLTERHSPVMIGTAGWLSASAGWKHAVALKDDDTLYAWGDNEYGQLGDGTTTDRHAPVLIGSNISNPWIIDAGGAHTILRTSNGELWAWGLNSNGQLGDGTTTTRFTPVLISSISDLDIMSAGWEHTAALKVDGSVWMWGWNAYGQLGDNKTSDSHSAITLNVPRADFNGSLLNGDAPMTVNFSNSSGGLDQPFSYSWDFDNNGTTDSTLDNPSYIYVLPGIYTVTLSVADADTDSLIRANYITTCYSPVNIEANSTPFTSLQTAYNAAQDFDVIETRNLVFTEALHFDRPILFSVKAGYDCMHYTQTGATVVNGGITVSEGSITVLSGTLLVQ